MRIRCPRHDWSLNSGFVVLLRRTPTDTHPREPPKVTLIPMAEMHLPFSVRHYVSSIPSAYALTTMSYFCFFFLIVCLLPSHKALCSGCAHYTHTALGRLGLGREDMLWLV